MFAKVRPNHETKAAGMTGVSVLSTRGLLVREHHSTDQRAHLLTVGRSLRSLSWRESFPSEKEISTFYLVDVSLKSCMSP